MVVLPRPVDRFVVLLDGILSSIKSMLPSVAGMLVSFMIGQDGCFLQRLALE